MKKRKTRYVSLQIRLVRCVGAGVAMAAMYTVWVSIVYMFHPQTFVQLGASYADVVEFYFAAAALGGGFVAVMWPLCRFWIVAYITTISVGELIAAGCGVILDGVPTRWDLAGWLSMLLYGLVLGLFFGRSLHRGVKAHALDWSSD